MFEKKRTFSRLTIYTFYSRLPFEKHKKESCDKFDLELMKEIEDAKTKKDEEESTATNKVPYIRN